MLIAKQRMLVMRLRGEIDHHTAGGIRKQLERELKMSGAVNIALDFKEVTFMDSSGIGVIIGRYKTVRALGGSMVIYNASEQIRRLLDMSGIRRIAVICSTLSEGLNIINSGKAIR